MHVTGTVSGVLHCDDRILCPYCAARRETEVLRQRRAEYSTIFARGHRTAFHVVLTARHTATDDPETTKALVEAQYAAVTRLLNKDHRVHGWDATVECSYGDAGHHYHIHMLILTSPEVTTWTLRRQLFSAREHALKCFPPRPDALSHIEDLGAWITDAHDFQNLPFYMAKSQHQKRRGVAEEMTVTWSEKHPSFGYPIEAQMILRRLMRGVRLVRRGGIFHSVARELRDALQEPQEPLQVMRVVDPLTWNALPSPTRYRVRIAAETGQWARVDDLLAAVHPIDSTA